MAKLHIRRTLIFIIVGALCGFIYMLITPKVYEGTLQLVVGAPSGANRNYPSNLTKDVGDILDVGFARNPLTEVQILRGRALFAEALQEVAEKHGKAEMVRDFETYYSMYDVLGEKDSDVAYVQARAYSPEIAADLANTIAIKYNEARQRAAKASVNAALAYLEDQIEKGKAELAVAMANRKNYKQQEGIAELVSAFNNAQAYEIQIASKLSEAKTNLEAAKAEMVSAAAALARTPERARGEESVQANPVLLGLKSRLAELNTQLAGLQARAYDDHPDVRALKDSIAQVKRQIADEEKRQMIPQSKIDRPDPTRLNMELQSTQAKVRVAAIQDQVNEYEQILADHRAKLASMPEVERRLSDLEREVGVKESNVRSMLIQHENLKNRVETSPRAAPIMFTAMANEQAVFPDPLIVGLLSVFGGAALGLLYSFAIESLRLRIYTSYQLADLTGLPVVASLPKIAPGSARALEGALNTDSPRILESLRLLAFSLVAQPSEGCRRLLFTGLDRKTGASSSAAQLALAIGQTGSRVILVDADLMGRSTSRYFKSEGSKGLAEALSGDGPIEGLGELLRETGSENVKLLPAGVANDRAVKESETKRLEEALAWLSGRCDYLIFDCPPCLRHSEAARLASETDDVYLVVSLRLASVPLVSAALDILRQAGANVVRLLSTEGDRSEEAMAREVRVTGASKALPE
jgi:polysaccharide biosynthesis transport protein